MSFVRKNDDDKKTSFGVIVGNRDVFPDNLAKEGRLEIIEILTELGYDYIISSENDTQYGVVETFSDAKKCADLFKRNRKVLQQNVKKNIGRSRSVVILALSPL